MKNDWLDEFLKYFIIGCFIFIVVYLLANPIPLRVRIVP